MPYGITTQTRIDLADKIKDKVAMYGLASMRRIWAASDGDAFALEDAKAECGRLHQEIIELVYQLRDDHS